MYFYLRGVGGLIFYEVDFAYFWVVRSVCGCMLVAGGASGLVVVENVVEQCFWGAVLKGLVKKVAKSAEFLRGKWCDFRGRGLLASVRMGVS